MPNQGDDVVAQDSSPTSLVKAEQHSQDLRKKKILLRLQGNYWAVVPTRSYKLSWLNG